MITLNRQTLASVYQQNHQLETFLIPHWKPSVLFEMRSIAHHFDYSDLIVRQEALVDGVVLWSCPFFVGQQKSNGAFKGVAVERVIHGLSC